MENKTSASTSMKEYLKRYESNNEEKNKKKRKKKTKPEATSVLVVDEDPVWQKPVNVLEEEEKEDSADEKPQIDEDIEVKRMRRLELLRSRRPYHALSDDGSGWVSVLDTPNLHNTDVQSTDISPPRKRRARYDTPSPETEQKLSEVGREGTDWSPRQHWKRYHTPSPEPQTKSLCSTRLDPDISPPRRSTSRVTEDNKNNSAIPNFSDISPPRRVHRSTPEQDLSPPRQRRRRDHERSPEIKRSKSTGLNLDISPPRRPRPQTSKDQGRNSSMTPDVPDISPPRRVRNSSSQDIHHASTNLAPRQSLRDTNKYASDLSPPRKNRKELSSSKEQPKTGLITGKDMKEEIAKAKKNDWLSLKAMDPSLSGRGAEPVYRDKRGNRISKEEFLKSQKREEKPKEEKKLEWGKGLAQKREAEERLLELELEKDKPFARTRDDPDLDKALKDRVRWGDPMAHLVKKKQSDLVLPDFGDSDKMKESGFIVPQEIPNHSWLKRNLDAAPNRYGIRPGRHWDGVDRSNGYEKELFKRTNEKRATETEAYLWSVSDM